MREVEYIKYVCECGWEEYRIREPFSDFTECRECGKRAYEEGWKPKGSMIKGADGGSAYV